MTRTTSVRHAATTTKDSVRHAAEVVAPYADSARVAAARYAGQCAQEARRVLTPMVTSAAEQARGAALSRYDAHLAPRIAQAKGAVPPRVLASTSAAAEHTRRTARRAACYAVPKMEHAVDSALTAAEPLREEATARAGAALAALRGQVSPADVEKLVRRGRRRARAGRTTARVLVIGVMAGAGLAVWRWWARQANPEWLVEAPSATEPAEDERMAGGGSVASPSRTTVEDPMDLSDDTLDAPRRRPDDESTNGHRHRRHGSGGDSHG